MNTGEGLRRVVRTISVLAWLWGIGALAVACVMLFGTEREIFFVPIIAGLVGFAILQGVAWIAAGFGGSPQDRDGLIRPHWSKKATPRSPIPLSPTPKELLKPSPELVGVHGWLLLIMVGIIVLRPLMILGNNAQDITEAEAAYPALAQLGAWHTYIWASWTLAIGTAAISVYAGYCLKTKFHSSTVQLAMSSLWISGPLYVICQGILGISLLKLDLNSATDILGRSFVSVTAHAIVWTLYFLISRRVRNTYKTGQPAAATPRRPIEPTL